MFGNWFEVATISNGNMKIYFERQPHRGHKNPKWWLVRLRESPEVDPLTCFKCQGQVRILAFMGEEVIEKILKHLGFGT